MRLSLPSDAPTHLRDAIHDRAHLALGSRSQALRHLAVELHNGRAVIHVEQRDGRRSAIEAWHPDPLRAATLALERLRRSVERQPTGVIRAPLAPPR